MRPLVTKGLEALGALLAIALLWAVAIAMVACSRPGDPPPALDCPSSIPPREADSPADEPVCHGDDCLLPKSKR